MKQIQFAASKLRGALCCSAKGDVRFYLNAVYLDAAKGRLVSTNGHTLFVAQVCTGDFPNIIIPREPIDLAMKALGRKGIERTDVIVRQHDDQTFDLYTVAGIFQFTPMDARYPEFERVIPRTVTGKLAQFDPDLLIDVRDALRWVSGKHARSGYLEHNGDGPALYTDENVDAFCVVMPFRAGEPDKLEWYWQAPKLEQAA